MGTYNLNFSAGSYTKSGSSYALGSLPGLAYSRTGDSGLTGLTALDSSGAVVNFATNLTIPRVTSKGVLIEAAATNYVQNSSNIGGTNWTALGGASVSTVTGPDGVTGSAAQITTSAATTGYYNATISLTAGTVYTTSAIFKYPGSGGTGVRFVVASGATTGSGDAYIEFNVSTGVIGVVSSFITSYSITALASGWLLVTATYTAAGTGGGNINFFSASYNAATFYAYGAQVEVGSKATSWIPTGAGATATRGAEAFTLTYTPNDTSTTLTYSSGTASPSAASPINLGSSSGGAWVGSYVSSFVTNVSGGTTNLTLTNSVAQTSIVRRSSGALRSNSIAQISASTRSINAIRSNSISQVAGLVRQTLKRATSAPTPVAALNVSRLRLAMLAGVVSQTSTLSQTRVKLSSVSLSATSVASLSRAVAKALATSSAPPATLRRSFSKSLTSVAAQVASGQATRATLKVLAATSSPLSGLVRQTGKVAIANVAQASATSKSIAHFMPYSIAQISTGLVGRNINRTLTVSAATVSASTAIRAIGQTLITTVAQVAAVRRSSSPRLTLSTSIIASRQLQAIPGALRVNASSVSSIAAPVARQRLLTAISTITSNLGAIRLRLLLAAALAPQASILRASTSRTLIAVNYPSAAVTRSVPKLLGISAAQTSLLSASRTVRRTLTANVIQSAFGAVLKFFKSATRNQLKGASSRVVMYGRAGRVTMTGSNDRAAISGRSN